MEKKGGKKVTSEKVLVFEETWRIQQKCISAMPENPARGLNIIEGTKRHFDVLKIWRSDQDVVDMLPYVISRNIQEYR